MIKIYETTFKDVSAVNVETQKLIATFLPELGGKFTSLIDKRTNRQLMEQNPGEKYQKLSYAGEYVPAECSAFDDMFPTIDAFRCNQFPWNGAEMPDHGEVCGLPWDYEITGDSLKLSTYGVRFPYRFQKSVGEENGNIKISYKVTNLCPFDFDFVYAAHCMIAGEAEAEVTFPFSHGEICTGIFHEQHEFSYGDKMTWQGCTLPPKGDNRAYKFFFDKPIPEGWCKCTYKDGSFVKMVFPEDKLPWMGLWLNTGSFKNMYNIAFEPCSGTHDRPDIARQHGKFSVLPAKGTYEWFLKFEVND